MIIRSKAKINLFLKIYGKSSRYHLLHSLVAFCDDIYDELIINKTSNSSHNLEIMSSEFSSQVPLKHNLLLKVLELCANEKKFFIKLTKNIPVAAGLGGGSSNAAVLLKYLLETTPIPQNIDLISIVKALGSDVPVCLNQSASYISSYGQEVQKTILPTGIWAVLVNPKIELATADVFRNFNFNENTYIKNYPYFKDQNDFITYLKSLDNDLEVVAIKILPQITGILSAIAETKNCLLARMSGSGATCFGLFNCKNDAIEAKNQLQKDNHNFWIKETLLI